MVRPVYQNKHTLRAPFQHIFNGEMTLPFAGAAFAEGQQTAEMAITLARFGIGHEFRTILQNQAHRDEIGQA